MIWYVTLADGSVVETIDLQATLASHVGWREYSRVAPTVEVPVSLLATLGAQRGGGTTHAARDATVTDLLIAAGLEEEEDNG